MRDADLPLDPNNPVHSVAWNISRQDDGAIWIEKEIPVKRGAQIHVSVSFEFYSEQESFNVIAGVCAYAGILNPEAEANLTVVGNANEFAGWKQYTYTTTLLTSSTGEIWVAAGITVRWETEMTYNLDDVIVTIN